MESPTMTLDLILHDIERSSQATQMLKPAFSAKELS